MFGFRLKTLSYYLDKGLSRKKAEKVSSQVQKCEKDRKCMEIMEAMGTALQPKTGLSPDFTKNFLANLEDVKRIKQPSYAKIVAVSGLIMIYRNGFSEGVTAFPEMDLKKGDKLRVIGNSVALIELNDGSTIYLNRETDLEFKENPQHLFLHTGEIFSMMKSQKNPFLVSTPSAVLAVLGTDFSAKVTEKLSTILSVLKGSVMFKNDIGGVVVNKKQRVEASRTAKPVPEKITDPLSLVSWTGGLNPKKVTKGAIMKKLLYILAVLVVGALGFLGYSFYQNNLVYEPEAKPSSGRKTESPVPTGQTQPDSAGFLMQIPALGDDYFLINRVQPVGMHCVLRMEQTQHTEVKAALMPQPMRSKMLLTMDVVTDVVSEQPGGGREILIKFANVKMEQRGGKSSVMFDSSTSRENDPKNPVAKMMRILSDSELRFITDAKGKILEAEGFEQYLQLASSQMPGSQQQDMSMDYIKDMGNVFSDQALPDRPIKIGESWPFQSDLPLPGIGTLIMNLEYTFKKWDNKYNRKCALIEFSGTMSNLPSNSPGQKETLEITEGASNGRMWMDKETGIPMETITDQNMLLQVTAKVPLPSGVREQKSEVKINQQIKVKLVEVKYN